MDAHRRMVQELEPTFSFDQYASDLCSQQQQSFSAAPIGVYNSSSFSSLIDELGISYTSTPDRLPLIGSIVCTSAGDFTPCANYSRTFALPSTLSDGSPVDSFYMDIAADCRDSQALTLSLGIRNDETTVTIPCSPLAQSYGFGLVKVKGLKSITLTSEFRNYFITSINLGSTRCNESASETTSDVTNSRPSDPLTTVNATLPLVPPLPPPVPLINASAMQLRTDGRPRPEAKGVMNQMGLMSRVKPKDLAKEKEAMNTKKPMTDKRRKDGLSGLTAKPSRQMMQRQ
jgi:hypothetical protein